jgi:uncharacterized protein YeaC (DUF1315 family)
MKEMTDYAQSISPAVYNQLKEAVETGKWVNGDKLTAQQKADSLQFLMVYQSQFNDKPDHFSIAKGGEIHMESKKVLKSQFSDVSASDVHKLKL